MGNLSRRFSVLLLCLFSGCWWTSQTGTPPAESATIMIVGHAPGYTPTSGSVRLYLNANQSDPRVFVDKSLRPVAGKPGQFITDTIPADEIARTHQIKVIASFAYSGTYTSDPIPFQWEGKPDIVLT